MKIFELQIFSTISVLQSLKFIQYTSIVTFPIWLNNLLHQEFVSLSTQAITSNIAASITNISNPVHKTSTKNIVVIRPG